MSPRNSKKVDDFFAFSQYISGITRCFFKHFIFTSRFFVAFIANSLYALKTSFYSLLKRFR